MDLVEDHMAASEEPCICEPFLGNVLTMLSNCISSILIPSHNLLSCFAWHFCGHFLYPAYTKINFNSNYLNATFVPTSARQVLFIMITTLVRKWSGSMRLTTCHMVCPTFLVELIIISSFTWRRHHTVIVTCLFCHSC